MADPFRVTSPFRTLAAPATGKEYFVGYRVIRASPQEFLMALRLPNSNTASGEAAKSRLSKYFQIRNKQVRQNSVSFEIVPDLPFLKEYYDKKDPLVFTLKNRDLKNEEIEFDVHMTGMGGKSVHSRVEVKPHELGSELKFYLFKDDYSATLIQLFLSSFKVLKITFDDPKEASMHTLKETK